jgi:hypothetical protein
VAFELIFGTAIVNVYSIYKENYDTSHMTMLQFRESLVRSLLLGMPFEELKPGLRRQSTSHLKRKLADHKLEEKEGTARDVRRRCAGCYEKNREQQSREACHTTTKKIKTFCSDCNKFFCLDCFNEKHFKHIKRRPQHIHLTILYQYVSLLLFFRQFLFSNKQFIY